MRTLSATVLAPDECHLGSSPLLRMGAVLAVPTSAVRVGIVSLVADKI